MFLELNTRQDLRHTGVNRCVYLFMCLICLRHEDMTNDSRTNLHKALTLCTTETDCMICLGLSYHTFSVLLIQDQCCLKQWYKKSQMIQAQPSKCGPEQFLRKHRNISVHSDCSFQLQRIIIWLFCHRCCCLKKSSISINIVIGMKKLIYKLKMYFKIKNHCFETSHCSLHKHNVL